MSQSQILTNSDFEISLDEGRDRITIKDQRNGTAYRIPVCKSVATDIDTAIRMGLNSGLWFDQIMQVKELISSSEETGNGAPSNTPVMKNFPELEELSTAILNNTTGVTFYKFGWDNWMAILHTGRETIPTSTDFAAFFLLISGISLKIKEVTGDEARNLLMKYGHNIRAWKPQKKAPTTKLSPVKPEGERRRLNGKNRRKREGHKRHRDYRREM